MITETEYRDIIRECKRLRQCISMTVELTENCNFNCSMCYLSRKNIKPELDLETWKSIFRDVYDLGVRFVTLTGGEVFKISYIGELIVFLKGLGFEIRIKTNGSLIDDDWIVFLRKYRVFMIDISVYGYDDKSFARNTNKNAFSDVDTSLRKLINAGVTKVRLVLTNNEGNIKEIDKLINYIQAFDVDVIVNEAPLIPIRLGTKEQYKKYFVNYSTTKPFLETCYERIYHKRFKRDIASDRVTLSDKTCLNCSAGKCSFAVNSEGYMLPCLNYPLVRKIPILQVGALNGWEAIIREMDSIKIHSECISCKAKSICSYCPSFDINGEMNQLACLFWKDMYNDFAGIE